MWLTDRGLLRKVDARKTSLITVNNWSSGEMKNADRRPRGRQSPVTSRKNFTKAGNNKNERAIYPRSLSTSLESLHSLPPRGTATLD